MLNQLSNAIYRIGRLKEGGLKGYEDYPEQRKFLQECISRCAQYGLFLATFEVRLRFAAAAFLDVWVCWLVVESLLASSLHPSTADVSVDLVNGVGIVWE
jgi:hypothetical protein